MDKYTRAFCEAMDATRTRNSDVAKRAGVVDNYVSQWRTGRRPIPAGRAPAVAEMLGVPPERISEPYARLLMSGCIPRDGIGSGTVPIGHLAVDRLHSFDYGDGPGFILLPEFLVRQKAGMTPLDEIRWTFQPNDAMLPLIPARTLVLVDVRTLTQDRVIDGGIYAFTLFGRPHIRRILIRREGWVLCMEDTDKDRILLEDPTMPELSLRGSVVGWL
ncbi:MAG: LexA family transcriptional regulator [Lysobacter sp.]|jgi:transcriptional regulator with XRE-family HTH domain|nr:LexA family transcriptional regulator [Lysobacter sp.]